MIFGLVVARKARRHISGRQYVYSRLFLSHLRRTNFGRSARIDSIALTCLSALTYFPPSVTAASRRRPRPMAGKWKPVHPHQPVPCPMATIWSFGSLKRHDGWSLVARRTLKTRQANRVPMFVRMAGRLRSGAQGAAVWCIPRYGNISTPGAVSLRIATVIPARREVLEDDYSNPCGDSHQLRSLDDVVIHLSASPSPSRSPSCTPPASPSPFRSLLLPLPAPSILLSAHCYLGR